MTNDIGQTPPTLSAARTLPPDLETLLRGVADEARAGIILPHGCGKFLLGLTFLQRQATPALLVAMNRESAALWAERWRESYGTDISRDPLLPAHLTVADRESLGRIGAEDRVRALLDALRQKGTAVILVEEPYSVSVRVLSVLERVGEAMAGARVLGIASRPPYDLSPEERERVEAVCGRPVAAAGVPAMVQRGILRPHRDLLYICDSTAADEETRAALHRLSAERAAVADRVVGLPFAGRILMRLRRCGRGYLYARRDEVRALVSLFGARDPDSARRIRRLVGETTASPQVVVERAVAFLLHSQTVLSEKEKITLRHAVFGGDDEDLAIFPNGEEAWRCAARSRSKMAAVADILRTEEEVLGGELRLLLAVCSEDAADCFERLLGSTDAPVAWLRGDTVYLPEDGGVLGRFLSLCRDRVERRTYVSETRRRYGICRPVDPVERVSALERLFEDGDIRVCLVDEDASCGGGPERVANVLLLTAVTERRPTGDLRYAESAADWRGRAMQARRETAEDEDAAAGHALHIWHLSSVAGQDTPLLSKDTDEAVAVEGFLDCVPTMGRGGLPRRILRGRESLAAWTGAMADETRKRRGTVRAFLAGAFDSDEIRVRTEIPLGARIPAWTAGRLSGMGLSVLGMGIGGFFLPHLARLTLQAAGMPGVLAIFLILLTAAGGMVAGGGWYFFSNLPLLIRHRTARASVRSLVHALLRALQESGAVGETVAVTVDSTDTPKRTPARLRSLTLSVTGATYAEADCVCRAVCEMLSPIREPRYLIRRAARVGSHKRGRMVALACPSVLAARDADAGIFADCLRRSLGRSACIYTRRGYGIRCLGEARARGYLDRGGRDCRVYVCF